MSEFFANESYVVGDREKLSPPYIDENGTMVCEAIVAQEGVRSYVKVKNALLTRDTLRNKKFLKSAEGIPFILGHEEVTPENYARLLKGNVANVQYKNGKVTALIRVYDSATKDLILNMIENDIDPEVSLAYTARVRPKRGSYKILPEGTVESYEAVQEDLRCNHLGLVSSGNMPDAKIYNGFFCNNHFGGLFMNQGFNGQHPSGSYERPWNGSPPAQQGWQGGTPFPPYPDPTAMMLHIQNNAMDQFSKMIDNKMSALKKELMENIDKSYKSKKKNNDEYEDEEKKSKALENAQDYAALLNDAHQIANIPFDTDKFPDRESIVNAVLTKLRPSKDLEDKPFVEREAYAQVILQNLAEKQVESEQKERTKSIVNETRKRNFSISSPHKSGHRFIVGGKRNAS